MERQKFPARQDWRQRCEAVGFNFYEYEGVSYWTEEAGYRFTLAEIETIETATQDLHDMCMVHVADVVKSGDYSAYNLPQLAVELIERSWKANEPHVYGRFDFGYDGKQPKMLEYNADTPTSLLEASVVQWDWLESQELPDQFNSIHDKLIARWKEIRGKFPIEFRMFFATMEGAEDDDPTIQYLMDTAVQAGYNCSWIRLSNIGFLEDPPRFVDAVDDPIAGVFKLYPWEWMIDDEFGAHIAKANTRWVEPAWKMLLSTKALLPLLWAKHKNHPNLLPTYFDGKVDNMFQASKWVKKPILAREGANITIVDMLGKDELAKSHTNPEYDKSGYVMQAYVDIPQFEGKTPIIGSWVVGDQAAGMGIREDGIITSGHTNSFVPHYFVE